MRAAEYGVKIDFGEDVPKAMESFSLARQSHVYSRGDRINFILQGIRAFKTPAHAAAFARQQKDHYSCSNFSTAHFYEVVREEELRIVHKADYGYCQSCYWYGKITPETCDNKSNDEVKQAAFDKAAVGWRCEHYYANDVNPQPGE